MVRKKTWKPLFSTIVWFPLSWEPTTSGDSSGSGMVTSFDGKVSGGVFEVLSWASSWGTGWTCNGNQLINGIYLNFFFSKTVMCEKTVMFKRDTWSIQIGDLFILYSFFTEPRFRQIMFIQFNGLFSFFVAGLIITDDVVLVDFLIVLPRSASRVLWDSFRVTQSLKSNSTCRVLTIYTKPNSLLFYICKKCTCST